MITSPILSKANQVKASLLSKIKSGTYLEGDRLPSDNELMRNLKVSRNTVREALSFLMTEGYIIRIQGKGSFVTKHKNAKENTNSQVIYMIAQDEHGSKEANPFIGEILRGMLQAIEETSVAIKLNTFSSEQWFISPEKIERICSDNPVGIIFAGFTVSSNIVKQFHQRGIKCCSIGAPARGVDIPFVEVDHFEGSMKATSYLISLGHKRIALLDASKHKASSQDRNAGYKSALKKVGIKLNPQLLRSIGSIDCNGGKINVGKLIASDIDFTAIIIFGDYPTIGAIQELKKNNKKIPNDVSLIMYSGYEWACKASGMNLTRIEQPYSKLGIRAAELLMDSNNDKNQHILLKTSFVEGKTCLKI
jgi:GntR family transcriptional regulator, arabinose operon transcriptional repressor